MSWNERNINFSMNIFCVIVDFVLKINRKFHLFWAQKRPDLKNWKSQKLENWFFFRFRTLPNFWNQKPNLACFEERGWGDLHVVNYDKAQKWDYSWFTLFIFLRSSLFSKRSEMDFSIWWTLIFFFFVIQDGVKISYWVHR